MIQAGASRLLFDSGPGTLRRLLESGVEIHDIGFICYSHFHPDHTGELAPLLFASKYPNPERRRIPLQILAGQGFSSFWNGLKRVYGHWIELPADRFAITELSTDGLDRRRFTDFHIESLPVQHNPESIAFRITGPGGLSVVYSGDTDVCDNLVDIARNADLFICESACPQARKVIGHLTPAEAGRLAARANVGRLLLTHFYPECDRVDLEAECRQTYAGPLVLGEDLMQLVLE